MLDIKHEKSFSLHIGQAIKHAALETNVASMSDTVANVALKIMENEMKLNHATEIIGFQDSPSPSLSPSPFRSTSLSLPLTHINTSPILQTQKIRNFKRTRSAGAHTAFFTNEQLDFKGMSP